MNGLLRTNIDLPETRQAMEFSLNVFTELAEFSDKKYLSLKGLEPVTSCVRDQHDTTAQARHV